MGKKKNGNGVGKFFLILGGILGLFSVLAYFLMDSIGAWWQVDSVLGPLTSNYYINAFGMASEDSSLVLEYLGIFSGIIFIIASILAFPGASKESKGLSFMSLILMIGALYLFCFALSNVQNYTAILDLLNFISSNTQYNVYFGSYTLIATWTWRLGNGFFIACGAGICTLIGAIKI